MLRSKDCPPAANWKWGFLGFPHYQVSYTLRVPVIPSLISTILKNNLQNLEKNIFKGCHERRAKGRNFWINCGGIEVAQTTVPSLGDQLDVFSSLEVLTLSFIKGYL